MLSWCMYSACTVMVPEESDMNAGQGQEHEHGQDMDQGGDQDEDQDGDEDAPTYHLGVRIPRALRDRVERIARAHHRNMAAEVRVALEQWADQHETPSLGPPAPEPDGDQTPPSP
jgi:hypothetical protein